MNNDNTMPNDFKIAPHGSAVINPANQPTFGDDQVQGFDPLLSQTFGSFPQNLLPNYLKDGLKENEPLFGRKEIEKEEDSIHSQLKKEESISVKLFESNQKIIRSLLENHEERNEKILEKMDLIARENAKHLMDIADIIRGTMNDMTHSMRDMTHGIRVIADGITVNMRDIANSIRSSQPQPQGRYAYMNIQIPPHLPSITRTYAVPNQITRTYNYHLTIISLLNHHSKDLSYFIRSQLT